MHQLYHSKKKKKGLLKSCKETSCFFIKWFRIAYSHKIITNKNLENIYRRKGTPFNAIEENRNG